MKVKLKSRKRRGYLPCTFFNTIVTYYMLHSEMLTRKAGAETTVPFFPLENWHVPIKVHSTPSLMQYNLGFEIFELYIYGSQNNSRIIINLVCRAQNKP